MSEIALTFIIAGWIIQLKGKGNKIDSQFIIAYAIGMFLLTIDTYLSNHKLLSLLNLIALILAGFLYLKITQKK